MSWLSLIDYANKYKISISTLRRKIKVEDIPFRLDNGKYFIVDEPLDLIGKFSGSQMTLEDTAKVADPQPETKTQEPSSAAVKVDDKLELNIVEQILNERKSAKQNPIEGSESVLVAANRLLDEIKKAYTLILQEKDEQIRQFRDEITDLKTLIRVLEGENERLKKESKGVLFFD